MAAVSPADLFQPWRESVLRSQPVPGPTSTTEYWDNTAAGHSAWWCAVMRKLFMGILVAMATSTRTAYGILDPAHQDDPAHADHVAFAQDPIFGKEIDIPNGWNLNTKDRARQLNTERAAYIEQHEGRWCSAVIDQLDDPIVQLILDPGQPELLTKPDKLYEVIMKRVVGGSAAEIGPRTLRSHFGKPTRSRGRPKAPTAPRSPWCSSATRRSSSAGPSRRDFRPSTTPTTICRKRRWSRPSP